MPHAGAHGAHKARVESGEDAERGDLAGGPDAGVVYVVAKAPRPGASKTRLCPPLTHEAAAGLAAAFLGDVLESVRRSGLHVRLICRDAEERGALYPLVGPDVRIDVQRGSGLGDAMESAFDHGLADGYAAVGVLGADLPTLPAGALRAAFGSLRSGADVALGPSEDGGYYLLAARQTHARLFRDITWSTPTVAEETLARCRQLGLRTFVGPTWYDVDDPASLALLRRDLQAQPAAVAPRTRAALNGG